MTTSIHCQACGKDLGATPQGSFCPGCGARLNPSQRSTGQIRKLDGTGLRELVQERFGALRMRADAPDALLLEGNKLETLVGRWDVIDQPTRAEELPRISRWVRSVGEFLTGGPA